MLLSKGHYYHTYHFNDDQIRPSFVATGRLKKFGLHKHVAPSKPLPKPVNKTKSVNLGKKKHTMPNGETFFGQMSQNIKFLIQKVVSSCADLQRKGIQKNIYYQQ